MATTGFSSMACGTSRNSAVVVRPSVTTTSATSATAYPISRACTRYVPAGTFAMTYRPSAPEPAPNRVPTMMTRAPARGAPVVSVTRANVPVGELAQRGMAGAKGVLERVGVAHADPRAPLSLLAGAWSGRKRPGADVGRHGLRRGLRVGRRAPLDGQRT